MRIWVDADACPGAIKDILFRAAERVKVELTLVANRPVRTPPSPYLRSIQVAAGFDVADRRIAEMMQPGDLVVTADVPLAAAVVRGGGLAVDPRGGIFTEENIGERLAVRDLMDGLRTGGMITGGPRAFTRADRQAFANQLDRLLARCSCGGSRGRRG